MNEGYDKKVYYAITFPAMIVWFMLFYACIAQYLENVVLYYIVLLAPIFVIMYIGLRVAMRKNSK